MIEKILAGPVPDKFKNDERLKPYAHEWITIDGPCAVADGKDARFIIFRRPRSITQADFQKAVTQLKRSLAQHFPSITLGHVSERIEQEVDATFVRTRGYPGYVLSGDNIVRRLLADDFADVADYVPPPVPPAP